MVDVIPLNKKTESGAGTAISTVQQLTMKVVSDDDSS